MKVLFIDDSNVAFSNISILVERLGMEVIGNATTQKEIETSIKRHEPQLILIDTRTSYLQGTETVRRIKKVNPEMNVVAISVFENHSEVKQVFASGVSDIITKPVESTRLIASLQKLGVLNNGDNLKENHIMANQEEGELHLI